MAGINYALILTLIVWWYLALLTVSIWAGVVDDRIAGNSLWQLAADIATGICLLIFVFAWWSPTLKQLMGAALPILLLLAMVWEIFALVRDYRQLTRSMESNDPNRLWVRLRLAMYWIMIAPAYACGVMSAADFYGVIYKV